MADKVAGTGVNVAVGGSVGIAVGLAITTVAVGIASAGFEKNPQEITNRTAKDNTKMRLAGLRLCALTSLSETL